MGPPGLVLRMIELFLATGVDLIGAIERSAGDADWGAVAFAAHSLKSSAGNLGLSRLSEWAGEIDSLIQQGRPEQAALRAKEARAGWDGACVALKDYRSRL